MPVNIITFSNELSSLVRYILKHNVLIIGWEMNAEVRKDENNKFCLHNSPNRKREYLTVFSLENKLACLNHHHRHHHVVPLARISTTYSRRFSLSFIASGRSSGIHPVSSHSCCMYVRAGRPAFARPYVGVHRSTSLISCMSGSSNFDSFRDVLILNSYEREGKQWTHTYPNDAKEQIDCIFMNKKWINKVLWAVRHIPILKEYLPITEFS